MSTTRRLTRAAWAALGVVVAVSAAAVVWRGLALPAFAIDALACVLTLRVTSTRLEALQSQALAREHESLHDPVTELPNRTLFHQQANQAIAAAARRAAACAVMLLDLDRFKEVNDTLGHHQGDLLLHHIATRLRQALRAGDLCARLGGDEFAVLVLDVAGAEEAFLVGQRLRRSLSESVELAGIALEVEASVGVSLCPDHGDDVEQLLRQADVAMYQAKRQHTGVELYSPQADEGARARLELLSDLRSGIASGELVVHYQPKVRASDGQVRGFEALVRWEHPKRGLLYPDQFVGLAENTGLMRPLTSHVLDLALGQCRAWRDAGHGELTVAVNISTRNLLDGALPDEVARRLDEHRLPACALELEITETTLMVDPVRAKAVLERLAALGVGLAIDDFGTGYTSLSWLSELPVSTLKIDKSFVMRMGEHCEDAAIVRSSVQLGGNLGLSVVAEGVEDSAAWRGLAELGCDYLQGYYFSRPRPAAALEPWLAQQRIAAQGASARAA
ncbi:MAG TPA: bifunctional diguanylate cyclase/phosphodiesterase [Solirubrobacteraceae bacterium]|nr:bifunctional diguanylate cyclase/phosphodiesterase [Solirubrobacteraceae bacterium]